MADIDVLPEYKEKLKALKTYQIILPEGRIVMMPFAKGEKPDYASSIEWDIRVYKKGVAGPLPATKETVEAIGGTADQLTEVRLAKQLIEQEFPPMPIKKLIPVKPKVPAEATKA